MSKGIIGKKLGMTQVFADDGATVGVTVVEVEPSVIVQVKTKEKDGYDAIQLGYGRIKQKNVTKPLQGHYNKANKGFFRHLKEFPAESGQYAAGQEINADLFQVGDFVDVVGTSKGKGFAGAVKRYHFAGGPKTHGQSDRQRAPGSRGSGTTPGRVYKGAKGPGHMGNDRVTTQNLKVVLVDQDRNLIGLRGSVPGSRGGILMIKEVRKQ